MSHADAPGSRATPSHHLAAVWFADLVGYSALSETNEGEALRAVGRFQAIVRAVVQTHGGRVVGTPDALWGPTHVRYREDPRFRELVRGRNLAPR